MQDADDQDGSGPLDPQAPLAGQRREVVQKPSGLVSLVRRWQSQQKVWRNVTYNERTSPTEARYAELPDDLPDNLVTALQGRGLSQLYTHQRQAYDLATAGKDVVIATPTASGKSLCYNLPVLRALSDSSEARALYLFPTKALSRDQESALRIFMKDAQLSHGAVTYDGDTPADARRAARQRSGVILTNPDMLHAGILPHHTHWARLFSNLKYVVIDELHAYRGVFGSHLANVLRRLIRIAEFHGSRPVFLFASATIGNPDEHASRMAGRPVSLVGDSGAPTGARRVLVYNPPVVNAELGIRQSYVKATVNMAADLVREGVSTLVFGQSRNNVEVMLKYLRERLARDKVSRDAIHAYRGGYLPDQRRRVEQQLRDGEIRCVVATNALELGIDIGSLEAVVCAGYPGTLASLTQRFGRGGRRGGESLAMLVSSSAPLDQYVAREASDLLATTVESARIDPDNVEILVQHIKCAAFELPFIDGDPFGDVPEDVVRDALQFLVENQLLHAVTASSGQTRYHWASDVYPANHVSLRSVGWDNFVIIDVEKDRTIGEMDYRSAHTMLHEHAIYQHSGEQYQVERLDFENYKAFVKKVVSDYFTDAITYVNVTILEEEDSAPLSTNASVTVGVGDVTVIEKVVGYKKVKFNSHENVGHGEVQLPEMQMHTTGAWWMVPEQVVESMPVARPVVLDAMRGLAFALHTVASVGLMIDPRDLGHALGDRKEEGELPGKARGGAPGFDPTIFLYDRVPGGIGLAPRIYDEREEILRRARALIAHCECDEGCPSCVGPVMGDEDNAPDQVDPMSRKHVVLILLERMGLTELH